MRLCPTLGCRFYTVTWARSIPRGYRALKNATQLADSEIRLGPLERLQPVCEITTAASRKVGMVD